MLDFSATTIINIDHHISSEYFGNVNWVASDVCATGEIILNLFFVLIFSHVSDTRTHVPNYDKT